MRRHSSRPYPISEVAAAVLFLFGFCLGFLCWGLAAVAAGAP